MDQAEERSPKAWVRENPSRPVTRRVDDVGEGADDADEFPARRGRGGQRCVEDSGCIEYSGWEEAVYGRCPMCGARADVVRSAKERGEGGEEKLTTNLGLPLNHDHARLSGRRAWGSTTTSTTEGATSTLATASTKGTAPASATNSRPAARGGDVGGGDVERQRVWDCDAAQWNGEREGRQHEMGLDAGVNVFVVRDGGDGDAVCSDGMAVVVSPDPFANGACGDVREVERDSEDEGGSVVSRNVFMFHLYYVNYVGVGQ
ncbi:hypothetical protein B0H10DRAFT_1948348 [Mycena sp. CBHHK59/15]|nr:hypothetical protein B0H10DRAFT_1948348 [Mycena sp. CBHHK59/15]